MTNIARMYEADIANVITKLDTHIWHACGHFPYIYKTPPNLETKRLRENLFHKTRNYFENALLLSIGKRWGSPMFARIISLLVFLIAAYLVFGDVLVVHANSSPQTFLTGIGRGFGDSVAGVKEWFGI